MKGKQSDYHVTQSSGHHLTLRRIANSKEVKYQKENLFAHKLHINIAHQILLLYHKYTLLALRIFVTAVYIQGLRKQDMQYSCILNILDSVG